MKRLFCLMVAAILSSAPAAAAMESPAVSTAPAAHEAAVDSTTVITGRSPNDETGSTTSSVGSQAAGSTDSSAKILEILRALNEVPQNELNDKQEPAATLMGNV